MEEPDQRQLGGRSSPSSARVVSGEVATNFLLAVANTQGVGVDSARLASDAIAAQHGDPLARLRLRLVARRPYLISRRRAPVCLPVRRVVRIRQREYRAGRQRSIRAGPSAKSRPRGDDDPDPVARFRRARAA
jgi:hypothetical protein